MAKSLSITERNARRDARELATVRRSLAASAKPARTTTVPVATGPRSVVGIHEYRFWQPAIPGSYRWYRQLRIA